MERIRITGIVFLVVLMVALAACEGDQGPAGPAGPTGPEGPSSIVGFAHINAFADASSPAGACVYWTNPAPDPGGRPCIFNAGGEASDSVRVVREAEGKYKVQFFGSYGEFLSDTGRLEMTILATITAADGQYVATVEQHLGPGEGLGREDLINVIVWLWEAETGSFVDRNFSVMVLR